MPDSGLLGRTSWVGTPFVWSTFQPHRHYPAVCSAGAELYHAGHV